MINNADKKTWKKKKAAVIIIIVQMSNQIKAIVKNNI